MVLKGALLRKPRLTMNAFPDLTTRKTAPFPKEIRERIDARLARDAKLEWPPPVSAAMRAKLMPS